MLRGTASVMWHHVSSALQNLWIILCGEFDILSGGADEANATSEEKQQKFMTASALLLNAAIVFAITHRASVQKSVREAVQVVREAFTRGII